MRIYCASSWRNIERHKAVVARLRAAGHEVYDFTDPANGKPFSWSEVDPGWQGWTPEQLIRGLGHPRAAEGFLSDIDALKAADLVVLTMPCGRSAHLELGFAIGAGKPTVVLLAEGMEPELMWAAADFVVLTIDEVVAAVDQSHRLSILRPAAALVGGMGRAASRRMTQRANLIDTKWADLYASFGADDKLNAQIVLRNELRTIGDDDIYAVSEAKERVLIQFLRDMRGREVADG